MIATVIRTLAAEERNYYATNDEEHGDPRIPLVNQPAAAQMYTPTYVIGEPQFFYYYEDWKVWTQTVLETINTYGIICVNT